MKYTRATTVEPLSEQVIRAHHPHLINARIGYLFREKASKSKGRLVAGKAARFPERYQVFFDGEDFDFLIELAEDIWAKLDDEKRLALLDHELSHCWGEEDEKTGKTKWSMIGHDVEEFNAVARRHGPWTDELKALVKALGLRKAG